MLKRWAISSIDRPMQERKGGEARGVEEVVDRLAQKYPSVERAEIEKIVAEDSTGQRCSSEARCQFFELEDGSGLQAIPSGLRPVSMRRSSRPARMSTSTTQLAASQAEYARTPSG